MDKQMKGSSLKKIGALLPWLWLAAGYVLDMWFQLVPGKWIVDSDLASEMMLTKILNQEGSILSHSWYYSTELRVVNMQWFYRLGLLLFPDDWHLASTFGMAIALLVFIAAALLLAKEIGLGSLSPWMAGALIWPFGMRYLVYAMYGGYYLIHMLLPMLTLALVFCSIHAQNRRPKVLCAVLACLAALGAGLNGVKVLMVFQAPFLLATMLLAVMALNSCGKTNWKDACRTCGTEMQLLAGALYTTVAAMAGYVINAKILAKSYSFKSFGGVTWSRPRDGLFELQRIIVDYFHEFGYYGRCGRFPLQRHCVWPGTFDRHLAGLLHCAAAVPLPQPGSSRALYGVAALQHDCSLWYLVLLFPGVQPIFLVPQYAGGFCRYGY